MMSIIDVKSSLPADFCCGDLHESVNDTFSSDRNLHHLRRPVQIHIYALSFYVITLKKNKKKHIKSHPLYSCHEE